MADTNPAQTPASDTSPSVADTASGLTYIYVNQQLDLQSGSGANWTSYDSGASAGSTPGIAELGNGGWIATNDTNVDTLHLLFTDGGNHPSGDSNPDNTGQGTTGGSYASVVGVAGPTTTTAPVTAPATTTTPVTVTTPPGRPPPKRDSRSSRRASPSKSPGTGGAPPRRPSSAGRRSGPARSSGS
jgi:hypothetical protein